MEGKQTNKQKQRKDKGSARDRNAGELSRNSNSLVRESLTQKVISEQDIVEVGSEPGDYLGEEYTK